MESARKDLETRLTTLERKNAELRERVDAQEKHGTEQRNNIAAAVECERRAEAERTRAEHELWFSEVAEERNQITSEHQ